MFTLTMYLERNTTSVLMFDDILMKNSMHCKQPTDKSGKHYALADKPHEQQITGGAENNPFNQYYTEMPAVKKKTNHKTCIFSPKCFLG